MLFDGFLGTFSPTFPTADTIHAVWILKNIDMKFTDLGTCAAHVASAGIHRKTVERYLVEQPIDCPQRTDIPAEWTIYH